MKAEKYFTPISEENRETPVLMRFLRYLHS